MKAPENLPGFSPCFPSPEFHVEHFGHPAMFFFDQFHFGVTRFLTTGADTSAAGLGHVFHFLFGPGRAVADEQICSQWRLRIVVDKSIATGQGATSRCSDS
ncbi:unnamed protein product [Effrenium voratum]|nr:unnamed protein product [Effrenium voratum]